MAHALPSGSPLRRRRALFGLFDAEGWAWAGFKGMVWFVLIILLLGYIPDRAYYFTVNRTLEVGLLAWTPVNLCPPENRLSVCPAPVGAIVPWEPSPPELALPAGRTGGSVAQLGTRLLFIGGSDGTTASTDVSVAEIKDGAYGAWAAGPALPEGRADAAIAVISGVVYLVGGTGPDGQPTDTVWSIGIDPDTSKLTDWKAVCTVAETAEKPCPTDKVLTLPAAGSGSS